MSRFKLLSFTAILGVFFTFTTMSEGARTLTEKFFIDSKDVQMYRGKFGHWQMLSYTNTLENLAASYGVTSRSIVRLNRPRMAPDEYNNGKWVFVPLSKDKQVYHKSRSRSRLYKAPTADFIWPVSMGHYLTSRHGKRWGGYHTGLDIACPSNTVVVAARSGRVIYAGNKGPLGNVVEIEHEPNMETVYAHNTSLVVKTGEKVRKGQIIAYSGTTGRSTGPHVHFEIRYRNVTLNPEDFLPPYIGTEEARR